MWFRSRFSFRAPFGAGHERRIKDLQMPFWRINHEFIVRWRYEDVIGSRNGKVASIGEMDNE